MEKGHRPSRRLNLLTPNRSLLKVQLSLLPIEGGGDVQFLPVTLQKGVFIQFDCCYYVVKHSIKVVIYEMCVAVVIFRFLSFSFFLFSFCFVIYQGEKSQA